MTTIEGIASPEGTLSTVQEAFRDCHGLQCGFCTPGFIVSVTAFLRDHPDPTDAEIREASLRKPVSLHGLSGDLESCSPSRRPWVRAMPDFAKVVPHATPGRA